jgi:hypothetical protein
MKFKLDVLVHLHYEETLMKKKKKKELQTCSKDLDNLTYGLFKRPGRYSFKAHQHKISLSTYEANTQALRILSQV